MKTCSKCLNSLDVSKFYSNKRTTDGLASWCKECTMQNNRDNYVSKRPKINKPISREDQLLKYRGQNLKKTFGISLEDYDQMLARQGGVCMGCKKMPSQTLRNFAVDHDRSCCPTQKSCGKCIRGILCGKCNSAIGFAGEDVETLRNLVAYLDALNNT